MNHSVFEGCWGKQPLSLPPHMQIIVQDFFALCEVGSELTGHLEVMVATAGMQLQRTLALAFLLSCILLMRGKSRCHPTNKLMSEETEVQCKEPC